MFDKEILRGLVKYNKYKKFCFDNFIDIEYNEYYEMKLKARYNKSSRIKKRILYLLVHYNFVYFCTFTFNDKYINCCNKTKRNLIKNSLLSFSSDIKFILNVDFGDLHDREHYHGIIATNNSSDLKNFLSITYPCFSWTEKIKTDKKSITKLSKYVNKLSNHCIKSSTHNSRVIYNFKGFDGISPTQHDATNYFYIYSSLIGLE